ncbi:probable arabinose 5-phosphate isomerase [Olea europaea subsp. europaea]|uniref:Probable arabinose 5-phosphate isomerase n=1 Tax=Olea europaea subsp. europaea TaxID=158383 RepID=A0A8S0PFN3_OLEEU|nr:probable arabinose 5-phosphate isomerase [Olea europaea subsp. europaea]
MQFLESDHELDGQSGSRLKQLHCRHPRTIDPNAMAVEAMQKMESSPSPVQFWPAIDNNNVLIGTVIPRIGLSWPVSLSKSQLSPNCVPAFVFILQYL